MLRKSMIIHDKYLTCPFSHVCMHQDCNHVRLTCDECQPELHSGHRIVTLNNFIVLYKQYIHSEDNIYKNVKAEIEANMRKNNKSFRTSANYINKTLKYISKSQKIYNKQVNEIANTLVNQDHIKELYEEFLNSLILSGHQKTVEYLTNTDDVISDIQNSQVLKMVKEESNDKSTHEYQQLALQQCQKLTKNVWIDLKDAIIKPLKTPQYMQRNQHLNQLQLKTRQYSVNLQEQMKMICRKVKRYSTQILKFSKINIKQKQITFHQIKPPDKFMISPVKQIIFITQLSFVIIYSHSLKWYALSAQTKQFDLQCEIELGLPSSSEDINDVAYNQIHKELYVIQNNSNAWIIKQNKSDIQIDILKQSRILDFQWTGVAFNQSQTIVFLSGQSKIKDSYVIGIWNAQNKLLLRVVHKAGNPYFIKSLIIYDPLGHVIKVNKHSFTVYDLLKNKFVNSGTYTLKKNPIINHAQIIEDARKKPTLLISTYSGSFHVYKILEKQYLYNNNVELKDKNLIFAFYLPQIMQPCITVFSDGENQTELRFLDLQNRNKIPPYNFDKGRIVSIHRQDSQDEKNSQYLKNETAEFVLLTRLGSVESMVIQQQQPKS